MHHTPYSSKCVPVWPWLGKSKTTGCVLTHQLGSCATLGAHIEMFAHAGNALVSTLVSFRSVSSGGIKLP